MASFSYKYTDVSDVDKSIFLTWETGYRNLKVYYKGKQIYQIDAPQELLKGVLVDTEELKNISIQLKNEKPMVIKLKVGKNEYKPENKIEGRGEINGLIYMFWVLFVLGSIGAVTEIKNLSPLIDNVTRTIVIIIDIGMVLSYAFTAVMLTREKAWSYFVGTTVYILIFLLIIIGSSSGGEIGVSFIIVVFIRLAVTVYLLKFFPIIRKMMKQEKKVSQAELLDDF